MLLPHAEAAAQRIGGSLVVPGIDNGYLASKGEASSPQR
jgi:hypothetical protein